MNILSKFEIAGICRMFNTILFYVSELLLSSRLTGMFLNAGSVIEPDNALSCSELKIWLYILHQPANKCLTRIVPAKLSPRGTLVFHLFNSKGAIFLVSTLSYKQFIS